MKKPIIGITPDFDSKDNSGHYALNNVYNLAILKAGGVPIAITQQACKEDYQEVIAHLDGLLLTGGNDHNPALYNEDRHEKTFIMPETRQEYELSYFQEALKRDIPVMGICLGCQTINVGLKGTLVQDIPSQITTPLIHSQKESRDTRTHKVIITKGTLLHKILGKTEILVNTFHHQAVKSAGEGLIIGAQAPDGVNESIEAEDGRFILGVQWHPEWLVEQEEHLALFKALVKEAAK
jgi:putative glutamine amidotransferase